MQEITSLEDAIALLLKIHTAETADGRVALLPSACPGSEPEQERLYCDAWAVLASAAVMMARLPTETIDMAWIQHAETMARQATEVRIDTPTFLNLLLIARNGLRPIPAA